MPEPKEKRIKPVVPVREPGKRTRTSSTFDNLRKLPHPVEEILGLSALPSHALSIDALTDDTIKDVHLLLESPDSISREDSQTSQATEASQDLKASQTTETRLDTKTSLVSDLSPERSKTSQALKTSQAAESNQTRNRVDLMASLPDVKGFLKIYFQMIDHLYPQLDPFERAVHETLYRLSWGFGKCTCNISYQRIAERTGMSAKSAQRAAGRLVQKGLVEKSDRVIGYQKEQGIEWSVAPPPRLVSETRQVVQPRLVSETNIIETTTQIENTQTQPGVSVASRFTLEECRRYADHLFKTGQGITKPGGYATTIYRSGEADTLIDAFLNPPAPLDASQCPDCQGRGFAYIDDADRDLGVKPCKHPRLR
jgi:hypothetical protein